VLPLVKQSPGDAHAALLGGQWITQARGGEQRSVSCGTLLAVEPNRLAVVALQRGALMHHWTEHRQVGQRMPVAVVVSGDPAGVIAANLEVPPGIDNDHLAGLLRGRAVDLVKCRTHALDVPADAELIIEGYLDPETPDVAVASGGTLRGTQQAPVMHVAAITHRSHPIVWTSIDTGEHGEPAALLKVRERVLLPALGTIAPGIVDLHLPALGGLHNYAFVSVAQTYPFQARQIASALWGSPALRFVKFLVLLDAHVNVRQVRSVLAEIGAHAQPERDFFSYEGPLANAPFGRHIGIDATRKTADEPTRDAAASNVTEAEIEELVTRRWAEYGFTG
jgi:4-hydroxy-3-polyprenylbenzoate decarboxylase